MLCRDSTDCEPPTIGIYWIYWLWIRDSIRRVEKLRAFQALDVGRIWKTTCNFTAVGYPWVGPKIVNIPPHTLAMFMFMGKMMITVHLANFKTPFAKPNCLICPTWLWVWKLGSGSKFVPSRKTPILWLIIIFKKFHDFWSVPLPLSSMADQPTWADQHWTALDRASDPATFGFSWIFMDIPITSKVCILFVLKMPEVHKQTEVSDGSSTTPKDIEGLARGQSMRQGWIAALARPSCFPGRFRFRWDITDLQNLWREADRSCAKHLILLCSSKDVSHQIFPFYCQDL